MLRSDSSERTECWVPGLTTRFLKDGEGVEVRTSDPDLLVLPSLKDPRYLLAFVNSEKSLRKAFRLRYEVFNLELGEGLSDSLETGLDRDDFDDQMAHLVLVEKASGEVVGTYRLQTVTQALAGKGIYSAQEFDLTELESYFSRAVECGRACISRHHRSFRTLFLLWSGIAAFLNLYRHSFLFGCCSLTTVDPDDGWRALKTIREKKYLHPELFVTARRNCSCGPPTRELLALGAPLPLPKLFSAYMALGARVISEPAIDRQFKTVDFLVLLDGHRVQWRSLDLVD